MGASESLSKIGSIITTIDGYLADQTVDSDLKSVLASIKSNLESKKTQYEQTITQDSVTEGVYHLDEKNWSDNVKLKFHPKKGIFSEPASKMARYFKAHSDSKKQAAERLSFAANRAGSKYSPSMINRIRTAEKDVMKESFLYHSEPIDLGSAPADEEPVEVDPNTDYIPAMKEECLSYKKLLEEKFPEYAKFDCYFKIIRNSHDFGTYYSVGIMFNADKPRSESYAIFVANNTPMTWDDSDPLFFTESDDEDGAVEEAAKKRKKKNWIPRVPRTNYEPKHGFYKN